MRIVQQHEFTYKKMASIQPRASPVKFARSPYAESSLSVWSRFISPAPPDWGATETFNPNEAHQRQLSLFLMEARSI